MTSSPATQDEFFRLRPGVAKVERNGVSILVAPTDHRSVRVSPVAEELMPLLARGTGFERLSATLRESHPRVTDIVPKLRAFLEQLGRAGLLETSEPSSRRGELRRLVLWHPDRLIGAVANQLSQIPVAARRVAWWASLICALAGVVALIALGTVPHPRTLFTEFHLGGLLLFVLVVVPLHELAHAVACRLAGVPVGGAGLVFHGRVLPGPFVDTSAMLRVRDRWRRFWIPAAGPCIDLLGAGAAAWGLLLLDEPSGAVGGTLSTLFIIAIAFVYFDTNPLVPSDGSRMLEALLDDELARISALSRTRSRLSHWRNVAYYRIATTLHLQTAVAVAWIWLT